MKPASAPVALAMAAAAARPVSPRLRARGLTPRTVFSASVRCVARVMAIRSARRGDGAAVRSTGVDSTAIRPSSNRVAVV
ncbi:hypothetical protein D3C87_1585650 [compost metagenome]